MARKLKQKHPKPKQEPHQPTLQLVQEIASSQLLYGPLRGSHLPKPKNFIEAVRLYEVARYLDYSVPADEIRNIIKAYIDDEEELSHDEIAEFLRRMPPKDKLKADLARDLSEQMAINDVEGASNEELTDVLAEFPDFLKDVKRNLNRLTPTARGTARRLAHFWASED